MNLKVYYWNARQNAGDYFAYWLLNKMNLNPIFSRTPDICVTGSILGTLYALNTAIWGCGFHNKSDKVQQIQNIYAVRGKLTANKLNLPNITTGDPGILASKFYKPSVEKKYKFGIIPHYVDEQFFNNLNLPNTIKIIKISTNNIETLIQDINQCEFILSSSLHGIIFAHSYGIPAFHIKHNELVSKNSFKFLDYYSNFNLKYIEKTIRNKDDLNWVEFEVLYRHKELLVPTQAEIITNQNALLNAFPFKIRI